MKEEINTTKDNDKVNFNKFIDSLGLEKRAVDLLLEGDIILNNTKSDDRYTYLFSNSESTVDETLFENIEKRIKFLKTVEYRDYIKSGYIDEWYFYEIEQFLKFYIVFVIKIEELGKSNLKNIAIDIFDLSRIEESISEEDLENVNEWIKDDDEFNRFYNKVCTDLSNSTPDKALLKLSGKKISKLNNYKGKKINIKSRQELKSLVKMWERNDKLAEEANKAHKKIKSNDIEKMKDKDYKILNDYLNSEIINSDEEYKNIYFYSLEFKLANELRKCVLKNLNKIKNVNKQAEYITSTVAYINPIPVLTIREDLSDKLLDSLLSNDKRDIKKFKSRITIVSQLIKSEIYRLSTLISKHKSYMEISEKDLIEFESIYNINNGRKKFENKYKIKVDYNIDDVRIYGEVIKLINIKTKDMVIDKIKEEKI